VEKLVAQLGITGLLKSQVSEMAKPQAWVLTLLRTIFDQPDADQVHAQFDRVVDALIVKLPAVAEHLDGARADLLAFPRDVCELSSKR
jgi:transposase-like protein